MREYIVWYNGWGINVEAESVKQARHKAWVKFNETYPTHYGRFMVRVESVEEMA